MLSSKWGIKGQSTLEYAIIIMVVIAALLTMNAYMKRGLQGKLRDASDQIGEQFSAQTTTWDYTASSHSKTKEQAGTEDIGGEGVTKTELLDEQYQKRDGHEDVGELDKELWPE